jgi:hypothetical protein
MLTKLSCVALPAVFIVRGSTFLPTRLRDLNICLQLNCKKFSYQYGILYKHCVEADVRHTSCWRHEDAIFVFLRMSRDGGNNLCTAQWLEFTEQVASKYLEARQWEGGLR